MKQHKNRAGFTVLSFTFVVLFIGVATIFGNTSSAEAYNNEEKNVEEIETVEIVFEDEDTKDVEKSDKRLKLVAKNKFDKSSDFKIKNFEIHVSKHEDSLECDDKYHKFSMCHGLSSISAIVSAGEELPPRAKNRNGKLGITEVSVDYDLRKSNTEITDEEKLMDAIVWWSGTQELFRNENKYSINSIQGIIDVLEEYPAIILQMNKVVGGHSVVPYALYKDLDSKDYYLEVHDSNFPSSREFIKIEEKKKMFGNGTKLKLTPCRYSEYFRFKFYDVYKRMDELKAQGFFDFENEDDYKSQWDIYGDAYFDDDGNVILTEAEIWKKGAAWYTKEIDGPFKAEFKYKAGGGTGADGFVFMFNKDNSDMGADGGYTAFNKGGFGIEFDSSGKKWNEWDPDYAHVALIKDSVEEHIQLKEEPRVADNGWHEAVIDVKNDGVVVSIDGEVVIDYKGKLNLKKGSIGFSAATGVATNRHVIDLNSFKVK